ncbi:FixH family protein [Candidatus Nitrospira bockiana]
MLTRTRTRWLATGVAALLLLTGAWLLVTRESPERPAPDTATERGLSDQGTPGTGTQEHGTMGSAASHAYATLTPAKQQLIGVTTAAVEERPLETTVRAVGRVEYDEQRITHVNLRISGWIDELLVDYTGQWVRKGQPLFTLYSPDLVATQDEFLLALRSREKVRASPIPEVREQAEALLDATRDRLRLWTLTDQQIEAIVRRGKAKTTLTISSPVTGYVIDKQVFKGMFVQPETRLYSIADLDRVWMNAEVYEFEVPFVRVGQTASATFAAYPGEVFQGRISYVYPYLNQEARTVKVRLDMPNPTLRLKPEMYGTVQIKVDRGVRLALPESALMDSGTRQLVFIVRGEGLFEPREVAVGPKIGAYYEVQEGLAPGDRVVTSGTFLIDSESRLMAASSMMGSLGMAGIKMEQAQMGKMPMGDMPMGGARPQAGTPVAETPQEKQAGGVTIALATEPAPPRLGENLVRVTVKGEGDAPLSDATVRLTYTMPMPGMMPATVPMKAGQDGRYETQINLGMAGQWDLTVIVQRPGQAAVKGTFSVTAGGPKAK